jgi:orotidine-5'-phosphate decarboxylase
LIGAIVDARLKGGEKSSAETFTNNPYQGLGIEKFMATVSEKCKAASEVLAKKATPEEASAFRAWVLSIADDVSKAARQGGFLGFGGTQVSVEEVAAIDRIKSALAA